MNKKKHYYGFHKPYGCGKVKVYRFDSPRQRYTQLLSLGANTLELSERDPRVQKALALAKKGASWPIEVPSYE